MNWNEIIGDQITFDMIVECGVGNPTREESDSILSLGYYGKICSKENVEGFKGGIPWKPTGQYGVTADLVDGPLEKWFEKKEDAIKYVVDRYEYWNGEDSFGTDFGQWSLIGFTISECGIKRERMG
jgi:hypothetical protein